MIPRKKTFIEQLAAAEPITYDQQVIIDFADEHEHLGDALKRKWDKRHHKDPCLYIKGNDFFKANDRCPLISQSRIRIYLNIHSDPNALYYADAPIDIKKLVSRLDFYMQGKDYVLNLVACGAARGDKVDPTIKNQNSIAREIHTLLVAASQRDVPVIARTHVVSGTRPSIPGVKSRKMTAHLKLPWTGSSDANTYKFVKRQPGSKLIICNDERGKEIIIDAYFSTWRNRVFKVLGKILSKEKNPNQKENIQVGIDALRSKNAEQIYTTIKELLDDPHSKLNARRGFFKERAPRKLQELINEWENIQKSIYTVKDRRYTNPAT